MLFEPFPLEKCEVVEALPDLPAPQRPEVHDQRARGGHQLGHLAQHGGRHLPGHQRVLRGRHGMHRVCALQRAQLLQGAR